ncbi:hypothetical protein [Kribbella solani]|uniref:Uncharacterized protein n=1 Tax=Kribbella solani TaxID=236067 RepID=A0A841DR47_9ACTN|nr:hypothetical protein [Kribbella solani]MBB5981052.1 hypothetical protein [Kribbella solani]
MAHVAPTSHRRPARASHRGHRSDDGSIRITSWLGLAFAFVVGWILTAQSHVGVHAAGVTLLVMLVPVTIGTFVTGFRQGLGSWKAALLAGAGLAFTLLKFFF